MITLKQLFVVFLGVVFLLSPNITFATPLFVYDSGMSLEQSLGTDTLLPQIAVDGDDIYVFTRGNTAPNDIMEFDTTNVATPFAHTSFIVYDGFGSTLTEPQIQVYEPGKMYVGFIEDTGGFGVFIDIVRSTDSGMTFTITGDPGGGLPGIPDSVEISSSPPAGSNFKIAGDAGTDNVYVGYIDSGVLKFVSAVYCDCADLYDLSYAPVNINGATTGASNMDMIKDSTNVYVAWEDSSTGTSEIGFAYSNDNGSTWNPVNLSTTPGVSSSDPKLSVSGSNVYVTWIEDVGINTEIHFRGSTDSGMTFGPDTRLDNPSISAVSATPQIDSSGSNVYVVWADNVDGLSANQEIVLRKSSDSGVSFSPTVSISSSTGESSNPKISAQGTNLYIVWLDKTIDSGNGQLWFRSSSDSGNTFGGLQIISESPGSYPSPIPNIDSSSTASAITWKKATGGGSSFVKPANVTNIDVSFDKTEYAKNAMATVTVRDASKSGTVNVDVIVNANPPNSILLSETTSGVFSGVFDIDALPHSANDGDVLQVTYSTPFGVFSSFSHVLGTRSITWNPDNTPLSNTKAYGITVVDASANTNPFAIDTINVPIITTNNAETATLDTDTIQIPETDLNSGIFSCTECIAFMPGDLGTSLTEVTTITMVDSVASNPAVIDTLNVDIQTSSDNTGITIILSETSTSSNTYTAKLHLCNTMGCSDSSSNTIYSTAGDFVEIFPSSDPGRAVFGVVEPMLPTRRALIVNDNPLANDKVNLSFNGLVPVGNSREIDDPFAPGGGGGGVSRAGLVFNAVGGLSLFGGGGGDFTPPLIELGSLANVKSFNMPDEVRSMVENHNPKTILKAYDYEKYPNFHFPLAINSNGFVIGGYENTIETQTVETNESVQIGLAIYENSKIQHVTLFLNLLGGLPQHSDTEISYDKNDGISTLDPHGLIEDVSFSLEEDGFTKTGTFEIVFAKPLTKSDVIVRTWDENRRSSDLIIRNAIEVIPSEGIKSNLLVSEHEITITEQVEPAAEIERPIPGWIKTTSLWWSDGEIPDDTFVKAMQFLIQEEIIELPPTDSDSESETVAASTIPNWVRNTANWWASDVISDNEFLMAIQYLVTNGIIVI